MSMCVICRNDLKGDCIECDAGFNADADCLHMSSAVCGHTYHKHCINRWLKTRKSCPMCGRGWVSPDNLTLKQMVAAKWVDDEEKILELALLNIDPEIYSVLDVGFSRYKSDQLRPDIRKLLARTFSKYLEVDEIKELLAQKSYRKIVSK